jgi:hypothetical protein
VRVPISSGVGQKRGAFGSFWLIQSVSIRVPPLAPYAQGGILCSSRALNQILEAKTTAFLSAEGRRGAGCSYPRSDIPEAGR